MKTLFTILVALWAMGSLSAFACPDPTKSTNSTQSDTHPKPLTPKS